MLGRNLGFGTNEGTAQGGKSGGGGGGLKENQPGTSIERYNLLGTSLDFSPLCFSHTLHVISVLFN